MIKVCEVKRKHVEFHDAVFLPRNIKLKDLPSVFKTKVIRDFIREWKETNDERLRAKDVLSILSDRTYTVIFNESGNYDVMESEV